MVDVETSGDVTVAGPLPRRDSGGPSLLGKLARFFHLTFRQSYEDSILLTASALAFVTVLSLIPLLTAFSFVGARVFSQYPQRSLEVFVQILPYSDKSVVDKIAEFLDQAETIHGFGVVVFFVTTLLLFATVEESLNKIWNVSRRRPFRVRLLSFVLLLFWGPMLIGATFSSLILLRQSPAFRRLFEESVLLTVLPFVATVVGLTMLYWVVPYTAVRLKNALAGGLLAGILLEMLRQGFGSYVELFRNVSVVYGSYAFALLFMISIELTWTIILFGGEAAYTAQHFALLARGLHRHPPVQASWVGLAALSLIARRFTRGEPELSREELADRLSLTTGEVERILHPLVTQGLLKMHGDHGYGLAADPRELEVEKILAAYDHRAKRGAELVGGEIAARLEELIGDLAVSRSATLGALTVADLLEARKAAETPSLQELAPAGTIPPSRTVGQ
ncbi:MAG TPA: YhjD/YihY/BrkB family envelope integrity protein [Thermoanaerobaculia bacterium]|nr:YhjD/YihY/BrkB family envelope integrity protein [Thermoanaerobaculia bacterium]